MSDRNQVQLPGFSELPNELRDKVWEEITQDDTAAKRTYILVRLDESGRLRVAGAPGYRHPRVLRICHASRESAELASSTLTKLECETDTTTTTGSDVGPVYYVDMENTVFFFDMAGGWDHTSGFPQLPAAIWPRIKHVGIQSGYSTGHSIEDVQLLRKLSDLCPDAALYFASLPSCPISRRVLEARYVEFTTPRMLSTFQEADSLMRAVLTHVSCKIYQDDAEITRLGQGQWKKNKRDRLRAVRFSGPLLCPCRTCQGLVAHFKAVRGAKT